MRFHLMMTEADPHFFCNADPTILKIAYPDQRAKKLWVGSDRIHNTHCEFLHAIFPA